MMQWKFWKRATEPVPVHEESCVDAGRPTASDASAAARDDQQAGQAGRYATPLLVSSKQLLALQRLVGNQALGRLLGSKGVASQIAHRPPQMHANGNEVR